MNTMPPFDAIVLAGGRGRRLGDLDKAAIELDSRRLVDRVIGATRDAGAVRVIAAGPAHAGLLADVVVREDPPFSGPLAALAAALPEARSPWVMVLACDLVHPGSVVQQLLEALPQAGVAGSECGVILIDEDGYRQWLAGCYRTSSLQNALASTINTRSAAKPRLTNDYSETPFAHLPLRAVLGALELREVDASPRSTADIDTPEHLVRARAEIIHHPEPATTHEETPR